MRPISPSPSVSPWRQKIHEVIFEADTFSGKLFDLVLIVCILTSVFVVMLESIPSYRAKYADLYHAIEWGFTILFTIEYILRLISVQRPLHYAFSFYGIIDFLAIVPTYLSLIIAGTQYLIVIRVLRVLRVFRVLKMAHYVGESNLLMRALYASRRKIFVFFTAVVTLLVIIGSLMYLIEGEEHGFTSIPQSIYWAVVTLTTVGYGDISPQTPWGQALASFVMILGYSIIAIPTGIVTAELTASSMKPITTRACPSCGKGGHDVDAKHCKYCGAEMEPI